MNRPTVARRSVALLLAPTLTMALTKARTMALTVALTMAGCQSHQGAPAPPSSGVRISPTTDLKQVAAAARQLAGEYGVEGVLVAFDLDNTLLTMRSAVGSDHWYDWQKQLRTTDPCDPRLVADLLPAQGALYHVGAMMPTQPDASQIVSALQAEGYATMIVTARGHDFRLPTFRELRRNGLSFRDHAIGPRGGLAESYTPPNAKRPVRFEDGVYMLAGQHKGDLLLALHAKLDQTLPQAVVFADDKTNNVQAMAEALAGAGVRGELFHYQSKSTAPFDHSRAVADWATLAPALNAVEQVMGPVNFDLPEQAATCAQR